ncbi:glycogen debranching protein GlgX [Pararcticibacter amylolyticus]|uniref:Glycogen debranching enzyme GlgX n=1 Tax=Pararcticibacter amylolyticus TaxID=2173175 RepID=A0A2U2PG40_9SPHI|nr:glycogen debranching protein GlgX [Pararcticibacter amylolyticus]PWG80361.1 glycogen debranching enzyme GlgX [Pararcticibacter amylolyticus]
MKLWYSQEGAPHPLGISFIPEEDAYNFAIYSKHASSVTLLLYKENEYKVPVVTVRLDPFRNKSQRIWHYRIKRSELKGAAFYGYRIEGPLGNGPDYLHQFDPQKILLDPYAREVIFPPEFSRDAAEQSGSNDGKAPLGMISSEEDFDWQGDKPVRHEHDLVIYEMHVKGFTRNPNSDVSSEKRGTYAGVIEKIPYLKELGVTAVELMPVHQFDPTEKNYWGYMSLNFFAPHHSYTSDNSPGGAIREFKTMVRELHKAGLEVILDVVFNHTSEGDMAGPTYSFKGIDNSTYYLMEDHLGNPYVNYSGTGNTLRTDHPAVQQLIMDSLRYWVKEMHVDGFRFDLASVFSRKSDGSIGSSPIFDQIAAEPYLADVRLIAEPWDAGGLYQLGRAFPGVSWYQWNGGFRDDIRRFVRSDPDFAGKAIQRVYGSDDLFPDDPYNAYHPYQSINYLTSHDGFTLYDQVSYNNKHNFSNGQNNQDGHEHNYSWNCGWEGDGIVPPPIMKLRKRQARNFMTLLMLSNGTPMILSGDEFLNTQKGNNNPYNQDNETTWIDWSRKELMNEHFEFVKQLISFRKQRKSVSRSRFWREDVKWYGCNGQIGFDKELRCFAWHLSGRSFNEPDLYVMVNSHWEKQKFSFMEPGPWKRIIDTAAENGKAFLKEPQSNPKPYYVLESRSIAVFEK